MKRMLVLFVCSVLVWAAAAFTLSACAKDDTDTGATSRQESAEYGPALPASPELFSVKDEPIAL